MPRQRSLFFRALKPHSSLQSQNVLLALKSFNFLVQLPASVCQKDWTGLWAVENIRQLTRWIVCAPLRSLLWRRFRSVSKKLCVSTSRRQTWLQTKCFRKRSRMPRISTVLRGIVSSDGSLWFQSKHRAPKAGCLQCSIIPFWKRVLRRGVAVVRWYFCDDECGWEITQLGSLPNFNNLKFRTLHGMTPHPWFLCLNQQSNPTSFFDCFCHFSRYCHFCLLVKCLPSLPLLGLKISWQFFSLVPPREDRFHCLSWWSVGE